MFKTLLFLSFLLILNQQGITKDLSEFRDVKKDTQRFIKAYYEISLSPSEKKVLEGALKEIKAPCCSDFSALSC